MEGELSTHFLIVFVFEKLENESRLKNNLNPISSIQFSKDP